VLEQLADLLALLIVEILERARRLIRRERPDDVRGIVRPGFVDDLGDLDGTKIIQQVFTLRLLDLANDVLCERRTQQTHHPQSIAVPDILDQIGDLGRSQQQEKALDVLVRTVTHEALEGGRRSSLGGHSGGV